MSRSEFSFEKVGREVAPALDAILSDPIFFLDDAFVRPVDYSGGESAIVRAARVSYGAGTKAVSDDVGLIRYLMRHRHTSPLEFPYIVFHTRMPMDAWRQHVRHRTQSINEMSTRYSEAIDSALVAKNWRSQSKDNKQGSLGLVTEWPEHRKTTDEPAQKYLSRREKQLHDLSREIYEEKLSFGVAREQARKDLPLCTYTEAYFSMCLHNLLHYIALRDHSHAQEEIRALGNALGSIVEKWCPNVWAAFNDYHPMRDAVVFTSLELKAMSSALSRHMRSQSTVVTVLSDDLPDAWAERTTSGRLKRNRERDEFATKLRALNFNCDF